MRLKHLKPIVTKMAHHQNDKLPSMISQ